MKAQKGKTPYEMPVMDIVYFLNADIITTSPGGDVSDEDDLPID